MVEIIAYTPRAEFESIKGRPVCVDETIAKLQKTNHVSEIPYGLTAEFYDYFEKLLISFLVNEYQMVECLRMVDQVLEDVPPAIPHANTNKPDRSDEITELHDDIIHSMDIHFGFYAYMMKMNALMPSISNHYGGYYSYRKMDFFPGSNVTKYMDNIIYFKSFCDVDSVIDKINSEAVGIFDHLSRLQAAMSDGTVFDRIADDNRDEFCEKFLDNQEMDINSVSDRIEWDFMRRYEFPLGILDTSPPVSKELARMRSEDTYLIKLQKRLSMDLPLLLYPGLSLRTGHKNTIKTNDVKRSISRNGLGPFPPKGLVIG